MAQRVFVDANIFFSKTLLDWLFHFRMRNPDMFQLHSTEDVYAEVLSNMREQWPQAPGHRTRHRLELIRAVVDETILDYPGDVPFTGVDPHDYHVHAAAITGRADIVLTANQARDLTTTPEAEHYVVMHPDEFFLLITDSAPHCLTPIVRDQLKYWSAKPARCQLDDALRSAHCPEFADRVRTALRLIARTPG